MIPDVEPFVVTIVLDSRAKDRDRFEELLSTFAEFVRGIGYVILAAAMFYAVTVVLDGAKQIARWLGWA